VNDLTEEASQFLLAWWRFAGKWRVFFPPPIGDWQLAPPTIPAFMGIAGNETAYPVDHGVASPHLGERLKLAEILRP
jgi:hypothetical protein